MDGQATYSVLSDGAEQSKSAESQGLNLPRIRAILQRRLRLLLSVALIVFGLVALVTLQAPPKYMAEAQVMLDQRPRKLVTLQTQISPDAPADSSAVDTEVQVLSSHALARRVVDALHLQSDPEFNARLRPRSLLSRGPKPHAPSTPEQENAEQDVVADTLASGLKVSRQGTTYVIHIDYTAKSPTKAAQIANAFADLYLNNQLQSKFDETKRASEWLDSHLSSLRAQVESADAAVQAYKSANGLLSAEGSSLTEQSISGLNGQIATAKAEEAEAEARVRTAKSQLAHGSTGEDVGEALSSNVVSQLRTQRAQISREVADMYGRYGPKHPELLKAQRQLQDIDSQISAEVTRIISNLEAQASVARQRSESLEGSLSHSRGTLAANNGASVKLAELQRNADSVKTLYQSFLDRFKQTTSEQGIEQSDARVLSHAQAPLRPASPNVPVNLAMGLVLGLVLGIAAIIIAEAFDTGLSTTEEAESKLGVQVLTAIPLLSSVAGDRGRSRGSTPTDFIIDKPLSRFAEAFRTLKTAVTYSNVDRKIGIIAVTSSVPGEGKTTTTVGLAKTAALSGQKICVVDCDLRRRSVHTLFGLDPQKGLLQVLAGEATLDEVLFLDQASGAYILPLSDTAFSPRDVFGSAAMDQLLTDLRGRFDLVFLDTAPVLAVADSAIIAAKADVVLFLVRWRKTSLRLAQNALKALRMVGADVAGTALIQVDVREQVRAGYGEAAYYYKKYGQYYSDS